MMRWRMERKSSSAKCRVMIDSPQKKPFISISTTGERVFLSIEVRMISVGWEW
jgi:hypothetical protein